MRRTSIFLVCCVLAQLALPARADAWWDFLEEFSGPGPFWGFDIDVRMACFIEATGRASPGAAIDATAAARRANVVLKTPGPSADLRLSRARMARDAWKTAFMEWEALAGPVPIEVTNEKLEAQRREGLPNADNDPALIESTASAYMRATRAVEQYVVDNTRRTVRVASAGVIFSACRLRRNEWRRGSVSLGMRFLWHDDDSRRPKFANGNRISVTTFEPAFMWSLVNGQKHPKLDWVDYGIGAGAYWISSTGFQSVNGMFLEPVRLDIHPPTATHKWLPVVPIFRFGLLAFPGGFEPTAFAPRPDVTRRISRDWIKSYAFMIDLEPLLNRGNN